MSTGWTVGSGGCHFRGKCASSSQPLWRREKRAHVPGWEQFQDLNRWQGVAEQQGAGLAEGGSPIILHTLQFEQKL